MSTLHPIILLFKNRLFKRIYDVQYKFCYIAFFEWLKHVYLSVFLNASKKIALLANLQHLQP